MFKKQRAVKPEAEMRAEGCGWDQRNDDTDRDEENDEHDGKIVRFTGTTRTAENEWNFGLCPAKNSVPFSPF